MTQETEVLELRPIGDKMVFRVSRVRPHPHPRTCLVLSWGGGGSALVSGVACCLALSWTEQDWQTSWVEEPSSAAGTLQLGCLPHFLWVCFFVP